MIPLGLKIIYTLFVCALVPVYWRQYGPANFPWFSDIALLALVPALWLENALLRGLSCFHIILPLMFLWTLHRRGYDQRAFVWQTVVALLVMPLSYLVSNPQANVNWVYGFGQKPQKILPAPLFVIFLMLLFPLVIYVPTHLLFAKIFRAAGS